MLRASAASGVGDVISQRRPVQKFELNLVLTIRILAVYRSIALWGSYAMAVATIACVIKATTVTHAVRQSTATIFGATPPLCAANVVLTYALARAASLRFKTTPAGSCTGWGRTYCLGRFPLNNRTTPRGCVQRRLPYRTAGQFTRQPLHSLMSEECNSLTFSIGNKAAKLTHYKHFWNDVNIYKKIAWKLFCRLIC